MERNLKRTRNKNHEINSKLKNRTRRTNQYKIYNLVLNKNHFFVFNRKSCNFVLSASLLLFLLLCSEFGVVLCEGKQVDFPDSGNTVSHHPGSSGSRNHTHHNYHSNNHLYHNHRNHEAFPVAASGVGSNSFDGNANTAPFTPGQQLLDQVDR